MAEYIYNTLYTNYAFKKLANNLANPSLAYSPYNLISIKIGDGDNSANLDKLSLSRALYTLNISEVKTTSNTITFTCEIPDEVKGIEITEIGLFDTVNGEDKLFSYSRVQAVKPADLGYELTVELNLSLKTVNYYPEKVRLVINEYDYITQEMLENLENTFLYLETNLERIIDFNAYEVGRNLPQVYYAKQRHINEMVTGCTFASRYFGLWNRYGNNLKNSFFIKYDNYLAYSINDMASDAYLDVYNGKFTSFGDNISFTGPCTLSFSAKLGSVSEDNSNSKAILNKINAYTNHFNFELIDNKLVFTLYASPQNYTLTYNLTEVQKPRCLENYNNYTITFNGDLSNPTCTLYINGVTQETTETKSAITEQTSGTGVPLRNFIYNSNEDLLDLDISNIVFLNTELIYTEVSQLSRILKIRNVESN